MSDQPSSGESQEKSSRRGSPWIGGAVLIVLGLVFLLQNITGFELRNWWAIFILIPAFGMFARTYRDYQNNGRLTAAGRGPLIGGLLLTFIAAAFLFSLDFGNLWPVFLILGGIALLLNAFWTG
ncbi:MAG: hypothetical protein A2Z49_03205 [Chloroflexi bacterium RBG_19FT_COMBO_56_12]|nr:MAG: hypothetical protein A2Z49_03205 [Chloroflexi bacterium RBG_19FT_COMBO_56_12]